MSKIITYDLCTPGRDYQPLYNAIAQYSKRAKVCESCWIVSGASSAADIGNYLRMFLDANDRLFVAALTGEAAYANAISGDKHVRTAINSYCSDN